MNHTVHITTLGCKVNQAESEALAAWCRDGRGWQIKRREPDADLCIINTCAVTGRAEMQSRQAVRKAVRNHPGAVIVVTGCYAQRDPEAFERIEGVDYIIGQSDKHRIPQIISPEQGNAPFHPIKKSASQPAVFRTALSEYKRFDPMPAPATGARTRPFLKIQDGCDAFCTYCIVPYTRGRSRSLAPERLISEFKQLVYTGAPEIVLSGIHIGRYGQDLDPQTDLVSLLRSLETVEGNHRIRLSSIEPTELTDNLLDLIADSGRICPHFHIPMQSGDTDILKKMHRPYEPENFQALTEKIRTRFPDAAIGADVMIGFPGEDRAAFNRTFELIRNLPVTYLHVFPYSPRPGTPAARFAGRVPAGEIRQRCRTIQELGREKKRHFFSRMIGKTLNVIIEEYDYHNTGNSKGLSANYIPVILENTGAQKALRTDCRITKLDSDNTLRARPISNPCKKK
ncbi:MAG: tRNA (N(6)-L-threonylcarbamoyladenosine(37)-C(2))-methylthiotransferase MtaB [Desulfobacteraceae bacterium]|nr:tRNA (N(6)-L-threonylcarbamoyladenosine(37)-C(2))-methylthiotransferase MtaB [Desulfobacteraceae bacterium]